MLKKPIYHIILENKLRYTNHFEHLPYVPHNARKSFEYLIGMVIQIKGKEAQERIAVIEQQNHNLGEYWQD